MNSAMTLPITLLVSLAFAGCASGPRVSTSGIVQTLQVGDAQRSCEALRAEVSELDEALAAISRNEQANAFAGATNSFNNLMGGSARFGALNAMQGFLLSFSKQKNEEAAGSRQQRRDAVMKMYFERKCVA